MSEPTILKRGKEFQKTVQIDFIKNNKSGFLSIEKHISFEWLKDIKQRRGRMDIFVHEDSDDFVTIIEIKATDWDRIKNIKRNLYRHSKQLFNYIDKYMNVDKKDVCLGIIYPFPPQKVGLKEQVEKLAMDLYSFPVYWYNEISE